MNINVYEEKNPAEWDKALHLFAATPLLSSSWLEAFRSPQHCPRYFRFVAENRTVGLLAGLSFEPPSFLAKKFDHPLFFFSGPAAAESNPEIAKACITGLVAYARRHGYTSLHIRGDDCPYLYDLSILPYRDDRAEYIIDLRGEWAEIQRNMQRSRKFEAKKAVRNGVKVHESRSPELVRTVCALLDATEAIRISKGYEHYVKFAFRYFDEAVMDKLLRNQIARIFYAQQDGHILCALFTVAHTKRACALLIGTNQKGYELKANILVWYEALATFKHEGYESLNLGAVANDAGRDKLIFSKTSWGAERQPCMSGTSAFLQGPFWSLLHLVAERCKSIPSLKNAYTRLFHRQVYHANGTIL
jgi:hypothetical protein